MSKATRDHGGGLDAAIAEFGGSREDWLDLSTGINPAPYPLPELSTSDWGQLPDQGAMQRLLFAARRFWNIPSELDIVAAPGASALIARIPGLRPAGDVSIAQKTYNEHAAAFANAGWRVTTQMAQTRVVVHPNNPDGQLFDPANTRFGQDRLLVIDESFCDVLPDQSLIRMASEPGVVVLKSFGKFWGLAGARLGFAIGLPKTIEPLSEMIGPWPISGPVLKIGALALSDKKWAEATRTRLAKDAARLDEILAQSGVKSSGGTDLFRLYHVDNAYIFSANLAKYRILARVFPYSQNWVRLGLPFHQKDWDQLTSALERMT